MTTKRLRRWGWRGVVVRVIGDACRLEVRDLPYAAGQTLVDAGISEGAGHRRAFVGSVECGTAGNNSDRADDLDLDVGEIKAVYDEGAVAQAIQLLGLGVDLAGPGDADVVV